MRQSLMRWSTGCLLILVVSLAACSSPSNKIEPEPALKTASAAAISPSLNQQNATPTLATGLTENNGGEATDEATIIVTHIIQSGETLLEIALRYDVPLEMIVETNNISDPGRIAVGDVLEVPLPKPTPTRDPLGPTPTYPPPPGVISGLPYDNVLLMPEDVRQHAREIFVAGQAMGNNPRAFSKVGDSTIENPFFLERFDVGPYVLANYAYLQSLIDHFAGSFSRDSIAVRQGMHSWSMMDPVWAEKALCLANEGPLPCEVRLHRPTVLLIRLGSNDVGVPESFEQSMQEIIDFAIANGVIPVLGTKADRHEGDNSNNEIIRRLAGANRIPLWDFDAVAGTTPGKGLDVDNVHLTTFYQHDYSLDGAFESGHSLHNLSALIVLDTIWKEIMQ